MRSTMPCESHSFTWNLFLFYLTYRQHVPQDLGMGFRFSGVQTSASWGVDIRRASWYHSEAGSFWQHADGGD